MRCPYQFLFVHTETAIRRYPCLRICGVLIVNKDYIRNNTEGILRSIRSNAEGNADNTDTVYRRMYTETA